jgi:hypothetical protein
MSKGCDKMWSLKPSEYHSTTKTYIFALQLVKNTSIQLKLLSNKKLQKNISTTRAVTQVTNALKVCMYSRQVF